MSARRIKKPKPVVYLGTFANRFPGLYCPNCRTHVDGLAALRETDVAPDRPKPGDVTMCAYCGSVNVFAGKEPDLYLRRARPAEKQQFEEQRPQLAAILNKIVKERIQ